MPRRSPGLSSSSSACAGAGTGSMRPGRGPSGSPLATRGTRCWASARTGTCPPLNEGRGINPGDTPSLAATDDTAAAWPRRSTKAGASTPATHGRWRQATTGWTSLNEGRGINPGDTSRQNWTPPALRVAQRRPGHQPRRHPEVAPNQRPGGTPAQRRPGHQPRRHPTRACCNWPTPWSLNEGRGINPGDTNWRNTDVSGTKNAQRRPGHQPRRHDAD